MARPTTVRSTTALLSKLLLAFASVAAALALGEVAVRLLDVGPTFSVVFEETFRISSNPILGYELQPGVLGGRSGINSAGFRDREFPTAKPRGVFRIAAAGDSVTFGHQLGGESSYPKRLEELLNHQAKQGAPRFEVLNFGVTGYNITQVVERIRTLGLRYQPDLLLYGYVLNDPQRISREGEILEALHELEEQRFAAGLARRSTRLLARSRLFLMSHHLLGRQRREKASFELGREGQLVTAEGGEALPIVAGDEPGFRAFYEEGDREGHYFRTLHQNPDSRERLIRGMADLAALARAAEIPAAVVIFPLFLEGGFEDYPVADLHAEVADLARREGLAVLDLFRAYQRAEKRALGRLNNDFMHPSDLGHWVAAAEIKRWLQRSPHLPRQRSQSSVR